VLAIIFIPFLGVLVFLLVGVGRLPARRREKQREVNELILARTDGLDQVSHRDEWPPWLTSAVRLNRNLGALPMVGGNRVELLPDYEASITRMAAAVDEATEFVHVQFYILVLDSVTQPFFDALGRAVQRGVVVNVLSDYLADWFSETDEVLPLDTSPVVLDPAPDLLDAQVLPSGPSFDNDNNLKLYALLIQKAEHRVSITSPYFVPEESTMLAIVTAASRGVQVELFASAIGDQALVYHAQRSYYEELLRAGVSVYLYKEPTVLHAKHFTIDDDVSVVGSSNMDIRSFSLNMEVSVLVHGAEFVQRMRAVQDGYRADSRKLELTDWLDRPAGARVYDNLARLTSSLQ
jgi:phosphatidylserine/phosphatidylglycerophosphate/cardiolipin synthase-like enzyme